MSVKAKRKHISDRTMLAAMLFERGDVPYEHAKQITADQMISLYHRDHNIYHSWGGGDHFTNLTMTLIADHREKTRRDAKIMAKSRRIRSWYSPVGSAAPVLTPAVTRPPTKGEDKRGLAEKLPKRKLQSRGFDKTLTRKFSGKVVKHEP